MLVSVNIRRTAQIFAVTFLISSVAALGQQQDQKSFPSAREASHALAAAVHGDNQQELLAILGPDGKDLISSGDPEEDKQDWNLFVQKYDQMHRLVKEPDGTTTLYIGAENWPFPVPLEEKNGSWYFDADAGKQEILFRRIGRNELSTIQICHELVQAEKEHFAGAHPGEAGQYAEKFSADEGTHNGLYHPTTSGQPEIGPLLADASVDNAKRQSAPFHGYYFRILTRQGNHAAGGAKSYVANGKMTGGFAFIAFPADYKSSGVMTFIVSQDDIVYEKDLGADTEKVARSLQAYDPGSGWRKAADEGNQQSSK